MDLLVLIGFACLLAGWFGMFFRVRRDFPDRAVSRYGSYTGPHLWGFGRRSSLSLFKFYWQHYRIDAWFSLAILGIALILVGAIGGRR
jgi:hypothetical protein